MRFFKIGLIDISIDLQSQELPVVSAISQRSPSFITVGNCWCQSTCFYNLKEHKFNLHGQALQLDYTVKTRHLVLSSLNIVWPRHK